MSSTPWSTSTASGSRPPSARFRGVPPSPALTFCCRATSGVRTTTASRTRTPALSTCCSTRPTTRTSSTPTIRATPTWPSPWPSAATSPRTASTPSSAASSPPRPSRRSTRPRPSSPRALPSGSGQQSADSLADADIVVATCGDVPTLEALAALDMLQAGRQGQVRQRGRPAQDPERLRERPGHLRRAFAELFGCGEKPVLFAFHAYAGTIRRLVWDRPGHDSFRVHGYEEKAPRQRRSTCCASTTWTAGPSLLTPCAWSTPRSSPRRSRSGRTSARRPSSSRRRGLRSPGLHRLGLARRRSRTADGELSATQMTAGDNE